MPVTGKKRVMVSWSTGKDSAWALHVLQNDPAVEVVGLVTSVVPKWGRVSMHGVREPLALAQAKAAGLLWYNIYLDWPCTNEQYEAHVRDALHWLKLERQVDAVAYGDLYLTDVRAYRERLMDGTGIEPLFPLWGRDTRELAQTMITGGLRARIVCLDPKRIPPQLAGAEFNQRFLDELPAGVDPCAESGEFHTFCYDGPMFQKPVPVVTGITVEREGFVYTDLTLENS